MDGRERLSLYVLHLLPIRLSGLFAKVMVMGILFVVWSCTTAKVLVTNLTGVSAGRDGIGLVGPVEPLEYLHEG